MSKKEIVKALQYNITLCRDYLAEENTREFKHNTRGMIKGYEFAIILLKKKNND